MKRDRGLFIVGVGFFLLAQSARAGWGPIKRITWTPNSSHTQAFAIDSSDFLHVVWLEETPSTAGKSDVYYKKSTNGGASWSGAKRLSWTPSWKRDLTIATDANNYIHVVWMDLILAEVYYRRSTDGGSTWGLIKRLTWTNYTSFDPALAAGTNSSIHFVWAEDLYPWIDNSEIQYKRSIDWGATWSSTQTQLLSVRPYESLQPSIAVDSNNVVHLVWVDESGSSSYNILYRRSTDGGTNWKWTRELTSTSYDSSYGFIKPALTVGSDNAVYLVYVDSKPGNHEIYHMKSSNKGATWTGANRLTWTPEKSTLPAVAIDSSQAIHVVWYEQASSPLYARLFYIKSTDGGATWSAPEELTWYSGLGSEMNIAIDSGDNIYIVWSESGDIYYRKGT